MNYLQKYIFYCHIPFIVGVILIRFVVLGFFLFGHAGFRDVHFFIIFLSYFGFIFISYMFIFGVGYFTAFLNIKFMLRYIREDQLKCLSKVF